MEKQMKKRVLSIALAFSIVFTMAGVVTVGIDLANKNAKALEQNRTSALVDGTRYITVGNFANGGFEEIDSLMGNNNGEMNGPWWENDGGSRVTRTTEGQISGTASAKSVHNATKANTQLRKTMKKTNPVDASSRVHPDATGIMFKVKTEKDIQLQPSFYIDGANGVYNMDKITIKGSPDVQEIFFSVDESQYKKGDATLASDKKNLSELTYWNQLFFVLSTDGLTGDQTNTIIFDDFRQVKEAAAVTVTADKTGEGTVTGGKEIYAGSSLTLTATPGVGQTFDGWYKGATKVSSDLAYTFVATETATYTAHFVPKPLTYTKIKDIVNGGIEAENCVGNTNGSDGLTNENEKGKLGWAKNISTDEGGSTNTITRDTTSPITGTASLKFTSSGVMSYGCQVFKRIDGDTTKFTAETNAIRFKVKTDKAVQLQFGVYDYGTSTSYEKALNIVASADVQTIVIPLNQIKKGEKSVAELPTTFDGERRFSIWFAGSDATGHVIYVDDFEEVKGEVAHADIKTAVEGNGTVTGAANVEVGDSVTLTATAGADSTFAGWYKGTEKVSSANPYTFLATESATYTAKFKLKPAPDPLANWIKAADVPMGSVEEANSVISNNPGNSTERKEWATDPANKITYSRTTVAGKVITGTGSLLVVNTNAAGEPISNSVRKQFASAGGTQFVADAQGIRFNIKTENDITLSLEFYDNAPASAGGEKSYSITKKVIGSPEVQQVTIPLSECMNNGVALSSKNPSTLALTSIIKVIFTTPGEVVIDNLIQVKAPPIARTITVAAADANGTVAITEKGPFYDGDIVTITAEPKEGFALEGWYLNDEKVYEDTVVETTVNGDAAYIAKFKVSGEPGEPEVPEGEKGFTPAFDLTADGAFSEPSVGSLAVDPVVKLFDSTSMKWSYDFTGDSATEFKNTTTIANVKLNSNAFSILTKTANDLILHVKLADGTGKQVVYDQKIVGSAEEQLISFDFADTKFEIAADGKFLGTTAVFDSLNKATTSMTLTLKKPASTSRAIADVGTLNFNNIADVNYQKMTQKDEEITDNPTYTVKVSSDGNGTVTGGGSFENGTNIDIVATPNAGYKFGGWYLNNKKVSSKATYSLNVDSDAEYIAKFTKTGGSGTDNDGDNNGNGDGVNGGNGTNGDGTNAPQTGDVTPLILLVSLITATGFLVTIVVIAKKKGQK